MKKTKIVCSIGPASNEPDVMEKMVRAGMNVARINFSHATIEEREKACASVREVRKRTGMNVAILWDTKGPEFRCGIMENDSIELVPGETIDIVKEPVTGTKERFSVNHPSAIDSLNVGDIILLENAKMKLEVIAKYEDRVTCKIIDGGVLGNRKSMSVPGIKLDIPYVSDGVMVARGDLGTEVPSEMVPIYQKQMINTCRRLGKISIVATEMLETMMSSDNIRPKRAETSDIANAVLDGTDAVMLSGETTIGKHPVETVAAMAKICETTEKYASFDYAFDIENLDNITKSIASNVVLSTDALGAKLICAATISGRTARVISNLKPDAPILALCPDEKTGRRLALNWGVYAGTLPYLPSTDEVLIQSVEKAKEFMELNEGDLIVITGGFPNTETKRITNLMKIEEI